MWPLTEEHRENVKLIDSDDDARNIFLNVKEPTDKGKSLAHWNMEAPIGITIDASESAIEGILINR